MNRAGETAEVFSRRFPFHELGITRSRLESLIGYRPGATPEQFPAMIDELLSRAPGRCDARGGYLIMDGPVFDGDARRMALGGVTFDLRPIVYTQVKNAERIALFACTSGPEISEWSEQLMALGDPAAGYLVDLLGSEIVETAMDRLHGLITGRMAAAGLGTGNRYSPGYCGWDVSEQHKLFALLPDDFCGIRLSDSSLMYPIKSVSGIIGIGKTVRYNPYTCGVCDARECLYRDRRPHGVPI